MKECDNLDCLYQQFHLSHLKLEKKVPLLSKLQERSRLQKPKKEGPLK